jgi:3-oxoadipate enol-lactonase
VKENEMNAVTGHTTSAPRLRYDVQGPRERSRARSHEGGPAHQTFVLSHALGCDLSMWDALAHHLAQHARVVRYDQRGHGGSEAPAGPTPWPNWPTTQHG